MIIRINKLSFCAVAKEIFSKMLLSLDFFVSFFYQGKNERSYFKAISFFSFLGLLITSCDSANSPDCLQTAGNNITQEIEVSSFDKILVSERIILEIEQGATQQIIVETGENLFNDIKVTVVNNELILKNNNNCNLVRDYELTTVSITVPDLKEIRSSTGFDIRSVGVLSFDELTLFSESFQSDFNSTGDFYLNVDVENLRIVSNNLSNFYLTGEAQNANVEWYSGDGQLFANELEIQNAQIFHRGSNNLQMDVKQNISGSITGYGDVILESAPMNVNVDETWDGRLLIRN